MNYEPFQPPGTQPPPQAYAPTPMDYAAMGLAPPKPTSVMVIGIISIVFGSIGLLCALFSFIQFVPALQQQQQNPVMDVAYAHKWVYAWMIFSSVAQLLLSIVLLAGGIGSVQLRPWGRTLTILYAVAALLLMVAGLLVTNVGILPLVYKSVQGRPEATWIVAFSIASSLIGSLIGAILPVAILICYRRRNVVEAFGRAPYAR